MLRNQRHEKDQFFADIFIDAYAQLDYWRIMASKNEFSFGVDKFKEQADSKGLLIVSEPRLEILSVGDGPQKLGLAFYPKPDVHGKKLENKQVLQQVKKWRQEVDALLLITDYGGVLVDDLRLIADFVIGQDVLVSGQVGCTPSSKIRLDASNVLEVKINVLEQGQIGMEAQAHLLSAEKPQDTGMAQFVTYRLGGEVVQPKKTMQEEYEELQDLTPEQYIELLRQK